MSEPKEMITVRANIEMSAEALQSIVAMAKELAGRDERGVYRVDTADKVGEMISRFLMEGDFESYVKQIENYRS